MCRGSIRGGGGGCGGASLCVCFSCAQATPLVACTVAAGRLPACLLCLPRLTACPPAVFTSPCLLLSQLLLLTWRRRQRRRLPVTRHSLRPACRLLVMCLPSWALLC